MKFLLVILSIIFFFSSLISLFSGDLMGTIFLLIVSIALLKKSGTFWSLLTTFAIIDLLSD